MEFKAKCISTPLETHNAYWEFELLEGIGGIRSTQWNGICKVYGRHIIGTKPNKDDLGYVYIDETGMEFPMYMSREEYESRQDSR